MRIRAIVVSGGFALVLSTTACGSNPCAALDRPSQADVARSNQNEDVTRTVGNVTCEWDRGRWVEDRD